MSDKPLLARELEAIDGLEPRVVPFGDVQALMRERARLSAALEIAQIELRRLIRGGYVEEARSALLDSEETAGE